MIVAIVVVVMIVVEKSGRSREDGVDYGEQEADSNIPSEKDFLSNKDFNFNLNATTVHS